MLTDIRDYLYRRRIERDLRSNDRNLKDKLRFVSTEEPLFLSDGALCDIGDGHAVLNGLEPLSIETSFVSRRIPLHRSLRTTRMGADRVARSRFEFPMLVCYHI